MYYIVLDVVVCGQDAMDPVSRVSWVKRCSKCHGSGRVRMTWVGLVGTVGSRGVRNLGWVGSGRVGSGRVGSGRVGSGRVGSGRVGSGRIGSGRGGAGRGGSARLGSGQHVTDRVQGDSTRSAGSDPTCEYSVFSSCSEARQRSGVRCSGLEARHYHYPLARYPEFSRIDGLGNNLCVNTESIRTKTSLTLAQQ